MPLPARPLKKIILFIFILAVFASCTDVHKKEHTTPVKKTAQPQAADAEAAEDIKYPDKQLEVFLDSIGRLPIQPLADVAAFGADSIFKNITKPVNRELTPADFKLLKHAAHAGMIRPHIAKKIFGEMTVDTNCTAKSLVDSVKRGFIYLKYFPFNKDKNKFDEFAVRISDQRHCGSAVFYFFKSNKLIAKQDVYPRNDDDLYYFKNTDSEAIVYRLVEFDEGSGIWWYNYFFYKYEGNKLIPVLNELGNGNVQGGLGMRTLWLKSTIKKTNPLTVKMAYYNQFYSVADSHDSSYFINDSTTVRYKWDETTKTLQGQFEQSKINRAKILSYYLIDNDYLFVAAHFQLFKQHLLIKAERPSILAYLNKVKNYYNRINKEKQKVKK